MWALCGDIIFHKYKVPSKYIMKNFSKFFTYSNKQIWRCRDTHTWITHGVIYKRLILDCGYRCTRAPCIVYQCVDLNMCKWTHNHIASIVCTSRWIWIVIKGMAYITVTWKQPRYVDLVALWIGCNNILLWVYKGRTWVVRYNDICLSLTLAIKLNVNII
jgi:hypothetical protein